MNKVKINKIGAEWGFVVDKYDGVITAEEFAVRNNVMAVNDNSEGSYQFVGSQSDVEQAYKEYFKTR